MTLKGNKINLPSSVIIPLRGTFKIWCMITWEPLLFHFMLKQGMTWFPLVTNDSLEIIISSYNSRKKAWELAMQCDLMYGLLKCALSEDMIDVDLKVNTLKGIHTLKRTASLKLPNVFFGEQKCNPTPP